MKEDENRILWFLGTTDLKDEAPGVRPGGFYCPLLSLVRC